MRVSVHCLHGFLGSAQDWESLFSTEASAEFQSIRYNFFSPDSVSNQAGVAVAEPGLDLEALGRWVNQRARLFNAPGSIRVLLGYSLGGRVAMHALAADPQLWQAAVLVSANPGLPESDAQGRKIRLQADREWARKFQSGNWEEVVGSWNAQPVLSGGKVIPIRKPTDFSRSALAASLDHCSLGRQKDLRPELSRLSLPILWVAGENDPKFKTLACEGAALNPHFQVACLPDAGHRTPWDQPLLFKKTLHKFLIENSILKGEVNDDDVDADSKV